MAFKFVCSLVALLSVQICWAFPNGGPIDACIASRPNQPNHSGVQSQPEQTNPYILEASSDYYKPGEIIAVNIIGPKSYYFKGFFIQARDAKTNEWIGSFEKTNEVTSHVECSAATHTNNDPKEQVTLLWRGPERSSGQVYFVGTVLQNYKTFWADLVADVRQ